MADIRIGAPAINRGTSLGAYTMINNGSANESGKITSVEIWASTSLVNCEVAIFYKPDPSGFPNNFSTRDIEFIGAVASGAKRTFSVDLDVVAGDYIGIYFTSGNIERDSSGCGGMWYKTKDNIPCTNLAFTNLATSAISLYGTGETAAPPDPPTNVQACDGLYTDKVIIIWIKSDGATGYQVYRDGVALGWLGDIDAYVDYGADPPTITPGTAFASDGRNAGYVTLNITGESANVGITHVYKVRARNAEGESGDSGTDTGYRGVGSLTKQWQRSAADSDTDYSDIDGATTDPYNDTGAPENGDGRYYRCVLNATGVGGGIDVGNPAINRTSQLTSGYTFIAKDNPANASGVITSIEIWANQNLSNCEVATFYRPDPDNFPDNLSTRGATAIGTVTAGAKRTFAVNFPVQIGDYIGIYYSSGELERDDLGVGLWYKSGDSIPCTNLAFNSLANARISLFGIGIIPGQTTNADRGYRAPSGTIDIGNPGIRRGYVLSNTVVYTIISKNNPADASGKITSVELFCSTDLLDVEVATFYRPDPDNFPNNLSTRDTEYIGTVTGGAQRTFAVDLDVEVGDYIGCVASNNSAIYLDIEDGDGTWYATNDHIPCTNQLFGLAAWILSLNGIGTPVVGIKWNGVTISKWNGKVISKFNGIG
ncbi:hypothetical protein ES708_14610 [subsurface metagenome]